jgi:murein DD-endopeptidase MepM/ murein hydrolase activator NlpD
MSVSPGHYFAMSGQFEPEGIYLLLPLEGNSLLLQAWGEYPELYGRYTYNGVRLKGHIGIDLAAPAGAWVLAADAGRVIEISVEPGGFGRYIKLEHPWGESFYAGIAAAAVDAGQTVPRGHRLARIEDSRRRYPTHLHFAIRISPYNRHDGWGGFSDPLPYLYAPNLETVPLDPNVERLAIDEESLPPILVERPNLRRP